MLITKQMVMVFSFSVAKNSVNLSKNYYKVLEVDTACDQKLIKNSYLKLVKILHPDVNPNGKQKFTEVQEAYEVLSDQELKKYYDQNNYCRNGNPNSKNDGQQKHSSQSKTSQARTGHQYYTHRTYASQNPHDYFYTDNEPKQQKASANKNNSYQYEEQEQDFKSNRRNSNFDKEERRARSQSSWQEYQRQKQQQQERAYQHQTPEERKMRDRLKALRGFTSSYNVLWDRHHLKYTNLMNQQELRSKKQEEIRNLMPQKVRKFYDKLMERIQKIAGQ